MKELFYDLRGFLILTFAYRVTLWSQIKFFSDNMGAKHLDIGAASSGTLLSLIMFRRWLKSLPPIEVTATDYIPSMFEISKKHLRYIPQIKLELVKPDKLPFENMSFDTVNAANSLPHFEQIDLALKEIYRVLKPEGTFASNVILFPSKKEWVNRLANVICSWGIKKRLLYTPYEKEDFKMRVKATGFTIIKEEVSGNNLNLLVKKVS